MGRKDHRIFSPGRIAGLTLKNRLVRSATGDVFLTRKVIDRVITIYSELAAGGVGLIIPGEVDHGRGETGLELKGKIAQLLRVRKGHSVQQDVSFMSAGRSHGYCQGTISHSHPPGMAMQKSSAQADVRPTTNSVRWLSGRAESSRHRVGCLSWWSG